MSKIMTIVMYALWIATILAVLATTFTAFAYEDLNAIALVLLTFSMVNTFFTIPRRKKGAGE